jgi:tryptophanyl-tRNA synthetase
MKIAIIAGIHGNENYGLEVIKKLPPNIHFFIANKKALKQNKRFIDEDLNRIFPGKQDGCHEEKLAYQLTKKLKDYDYVIDLHSSSNYCPLFGIITKPNKEKIELAKKLGLNKLVIMPNKFATGKALIDHVKCGISLEIGPHDKKQNIEEVLSVMKNLNKSEEDNGANNSIEFFEVMGIIKKQAENILISNFQQIKKDQIIAIDQNKKQIAEEDFTAVLVNEASYNRVLCLAAKPLKNFYKALKLPEAMTKEKFKVTPWEVQGDVDYNKLVKEFGVSALDSSLLKRIKKHTKELHPFLSRGIVFAHRDLSFILDEYEKGNKFFLYTGRSPSGKIHIGHIFGWMFTKWLQDTFDVELWFQFPDEEKFLFKKDLTYESAQKSLIENMLDIIALGFDPKKTHFIVDTQHADLMYGEACKVAKKITFNMVRSSFGLDESANIGSIFYTSMQAVPAFLPSVIKKKKIPCLIPHGVDQDPHFRITRDILPKLGHYKPAAIQWAIIPPLAGMGGKMASSDENSAIFMTDSPSEVKKKINKYAFSGGQATIEEHRKKGGNPDIDVSFQYLRAFFEPDDKKLEEIKQNYKSGKLLTGELKSILIEKINDFLAKHQKARAQAKKQIPKFIYDNRSMANTTN